MNEVVSSMARALHPEPDGEDEATASICAGAVAAWLRSDEARVAAVRGVSGEMCRRGVSSLSYGDTVAAALIAAANEVDVQTVTAEPMAVTA